MFHIFGWLDLCPKIKLNPMDEVASIIDRISFVY